MKVRLFAIVLASTLLLSGCGSDVMHGIVQRGMEHWHAMHSGHMGESMHHSMGIGNGMSMNQDEMMGSMDQMMGQMQGMMDGSMPSDMGAMKKMMGEMDSMMQGMDQMHGMMMSGSMPMEDQGHMDEMMGKMDSMMQMMEQMHGKMMDGSMKMDAGQMEQMQSHMSKMKELMQMMHGGMMDSSMPMSDTMPMSGTMPMGQGMAMTDTMHSMHHGGMMTDASKPFDARFIDSMIVHHQGAVAMANELLKETDRPELKSFAEAIISAQTQEIADMQSWRKSWYPDLPDTGGMAMPMGDMKLSSDESKPYDQRFLEAMISHHQGAVEMATMAQQMAEHSEVKTLADAIITAQNAEIEQMKSWLKEWFGAE